MKIVASNAFDWLKNRIHSSTPLVTIEQLRISELILVRNVTFQSRRNFVRNRNTGGPRTYMYAIIQV